MHSVRCQLEANSPLYQDYERYAEKAIERGLGSVEVDSRREEEFQLFRLVQQIEELQAQISSAEVENEDEGCRPNSTGQLTRA